jgi:hypothetical protein
MTTGPNALHAVISMNALLVATYVLQTVLAATQLGVFGVFVMKVMWVMAKNVGM